MNGLGLVNKKLSEFINNTSFFHCEKNRIDPFKITAVLHSFGTFVKEKKMTILWKNCDAINTFNGSTTPFHPKEYYYHQ